MAAKQMLHGFVDIHLRGTCHSVRYDRIHLRSRLGKVRLFFKTSASVQHLPSIDECGHDRFALRGDKVLSFQVGLYS